MTEQTETEAFDAMSKARDVVQGKAAHTPGPWHFDGESIYNDAAEIIVLRLKSNSYNSAVNIANARLIAAAPELLAALQGILYAINVRIDDPRIKYFDAARAAIAHAEGK